MAPTSDNGARKFSIKVEGKELDRINQSRKNLDDVKALVPHINQYKNLGWSPVALELPEGNDLGVDFHQPETKILWALMDLALREISVGLAVRLDAGSPLFVMRINRDLGSSLDRLGDWRSPCVARLGDAWEHHFLVLPGGWHLPEHVVGNKEAPLTVIRPGDLVTVPPAVDPHSREAWEWLAPPWDEPPVEPSPELLILLEDCGFVARKTPATMVADLPTWKEIYPLISHSEKLLRALLAPEEESHLYYRKILQEALEAGFRDLRLLLSLLWHAPHSELRHETDGREQLAQWAERLEELLSRENVARAGATPEDAGEAAASSSREDYMTELYVLAAQTLVLEQQLEELGDQQTPGETGGDLELQDNLKELEDLRQAVEDFLQGAKNLPKPE